MVAAHARSAAVSSMAPDDVDEKHDASVEAFRLGVLALGRLKAYDALASAVLGPSGQPLVPWWPVAAAFQRTEDRRALGVLVAFARGESLFGRAFAAKGLGALKDPSAIEVLAALAKDWARDTRSAISAVKALAAIGDRRAGPTLLALLHTKGLDPLLLVEVVGALGPIHAEGAQEVLLDLVTNRSPVIRAAAFRSLRALDPESFLLVLSGLDADRDWTVRAELATLMGLYEPDRALPRLNAMLKDEDVRVLPSVIASLVKLKAPGLDRTLLALLSHADFVVRSAAARGLGEIKPAGGDQALVQAFHAAARDQAYGARAAILDALVKYGPDVAAPVLREALKDKDWAVRVHAAALIAPIEPATDPQAAIRPVPTGRDAAFYQKYELLIPDYSPQAYIETERGTIQVELAVLDAPLTCLNFTTLAREGFFKGSEWHRVVSNFVIQDGDPRGDGEGGPGYTIRDEINEHPYLRGTVGMALDWADTGGSQFFITHSPQPHLDGRYTVFGQVVSGLEVLDRIQPHDKILRVRVWDGTTMVGQ
jgi:cyclophilin family peptidyl-prolyl cis-trans isomerase/HEAT repeat protein